MMESGSLCAAMKSWRRLSNWNRRFGSQCESLSRVPAVTVPISPTNYGRGGGVGRGLGPGGDLGVGVGLGVTVGVGVAVAVAVAVAVGVAVGVGVGVGVAVVVGVGVPQGVSVYCWLSLVPVPGPELPATA